MTNPNNPGARAFPSAAIDDAYGGLTKREWFAGQALAGLLAGNPKGGQDESITSFARAAFRFSDAMLAGGAKPCTSNEPTEAEVLRAIDSCGGSATSTTPGWDRGYGDALRAAEREVKRLYARKNGGAA